MKIRNLASAIGGLVLSFIFLAKGLAGDDAAKAPAVKKVEVGKNVTLEIEGDKRRVVVKSRVCLRQGPLEQFMTRAGTKEHEAIVAADVDAKAIHTALLLAGAEAGHPVRFTPKFETATGTTIKVFIEYKDDKGKTVRLSARKWIRNGKTKGDLDTDWVFGGSVLFPDPTNKEKPANYAANDGDIICVCNVETAMLDLPIESSKSLDDRSYEAHTERIPPRDTPVLVILEPVLKKTEAVPKKK